MVRTYTVLGDGLSLTTMFERRVVPPYGLDGGADGLPFRVTLHRGGESRGLRGKENLALFAGDRVVMETSGGGAYGRARDSESSGEEGRVRRRLYH